MGPKSSLNFAFRPPKRFNYPPGSPRHCWFLLEVSLVRRSRRFCRQLVGNLCEKYRKKCAKFGPKFGPNRQLLARRFGRRLGSHLRVWASRPETLFGPAGPQTLFGAPHAQRRLARPSVWASQQLPSRGLSPSLSLALALPQLATNVDWARMWPTSSADCSLSAVSAGNHLLCATG